METRNETETRTTIQIGWCFIYTIATFTNEPLYRVPFISIHWEKSSPGNPPKLSSMVLKKSPNRLPKSAPDTGGALDDVGGNDDWRDGTPVFEDPVSGPDVCGLGNEPIACVAGGIRFAIDGDGAVGGFALVAELWTGVGGLVEGGFWELLALVTAMAAATVPAPLLDAGRFLGEDVAEMSRRLGTGDGAVCSFAPFAFPPVLPEAG